MATTLNRREARREATLREILDVARDRLVSEGAAGVTLRPIAATVGLTAPGLYRYFSSRNQLLNGLCAVLYHELAAFMAAARDVVGPDDLIGRLVAVARAFREWSLSHPAEFELLFATPVGATGSEPDDQLRQAADQFGGTFLQLFVELWFRCGYPVPDPSELAPELLGQLAAWSLERRLSLPLPAIAVFLECWVQVYGLISMEVFGHLKFALDNVSPMFESSLRQLAARLKNQAGPPQLQ